MAALAQLRLALHPGGIVGRLFREFAVTLSAAILVSMVISLTATPMMCARLLRPNPPEGAGLEHLVPWLLVLQGEETLSLAGQTLTTSKWV